MTKRGVETDKSKKKKETDAQKLKRAFQRVASSKDGILVLRWVMTILLWKAPLLGFSKSQGEISQANTEHNVARREAWRQIRGMIRWDLLNNIEMEIGPNDDSANDETKP